MDDGHRGSRIRELRERLAGLRTRHADPEAELLHGTGHPTPGVIAEIRDCLATIMATGAPLKRRSAIEALIAEVQLASEGIRPRRATSKPEQLRRPYMSSGPTAALSVKRP